jgi:hypothetical protein
MRMVIKQPRQRRRRRRLAQVIHYLHLPIGFSAGVFHRHLLLLRHFAWLQTPAAAAAASLLLVLTSGVTKTMQVRQGWNVVGELQDVGHGICMKRALELNISFIKFWAPTRD